MIANIISRYTYTLTDTLKTSGHSFSFNADYDGKSQIVFSRKPKAEEDDFILIMDGKDIAFQGIISKIENASKSDSYKVTAVEMQTLFNQKVILSDEDIKTKTGIEDFIADQITKNFISSDDALLNIDYLTVTANTHTPIAAAVQAEDGIYNLKSYISNAMTMYGVFVEFEFKTDALNVVIEKKEQPEFKIDATLPEVQNLTEVIDYQALAKLTVLWKSTTRQFFLKTDGTITEDRNDSDRAKGSSDIIVSQAETEAAMVQEAHDKFTSNSYNHKVTFDVSPNSKMIPSKMTVEVEEGGGSSLPEGYRQLTYIESTGTQYIDTGFKPNQNTRAILSAYNLSESSGWLFGAWDSNGTKQFASNATMSNNYRYGTQTKQIATLPVGKFEVELNRNKYNFNGTEGTLTAETFSCSHNMYLFAINAGGTVGNAKLTGKVFKFEVYDNDVLVRDFIPCRNPSGDVGLYDLVTKQFFGNSGTGVFLQGEAVVSLPEGYERAQYIETTGTQRVDSGFVPNQDSRAVISVQLTQTNSNFFGARSTTSSKVFTMSTVTSSGTDYWRHGYNTASKTFGVVTDTTNRHEVELNKNVMYLDGVAVNTQAEGEFTCPATATIGAIQSASNVYAGFAKIYACQIYDNGALVRDYIPCKYNGEFGLYDLVEGKFYGNAGTGAFLGTVKRKLPEGYTQVDYIESTGTQYIDTGFKPNGNTRVICDFQTTRAHDGTRGIFGARDNTTSYLYAFWHIASNAYRTDYYGKYENMTVSDELARTVVDKNKNITIIGNSSLTYTATDAQTPYSLYLFAVNKTGTATSYSYVKIYSCQIYDNSALVRDYVPCINAQGTVGLYDMANDMFYTNAGTGTFSIGEKIDFVEGAEDEGVVVVAKTVNMLYVGRFCTIKTKNGIRTSIITAMELSSDSSMISLIFGNLKVTLIEKLKGVK